MSGQLEEAEDPGYRQYLEIQAGFREELGVKAERCGQVYRVQWRHSESLQAWVYQASKGDLEGEPRVARVLYVKEKGVRMKIVVPRSLRMTLEAEAQHREADEKYRDACYALRGKGRVRLVE